MYISPSSRLEYLADHLSQDIDSFSISVQNSTIMAAPPPAIALPADIKHYSLALETKPGASVQYTLAQGKKPADSLLVVFLNGLVADKSSWLPTMAGIIRADPDFPTMVAYDRYGQGLTEDRDPQDRGREEGYGHDVRDAAVDLHQLIGQVCKNHSLSKDSMPQLVLVANSIGCAIARLFAQEHPEKVAGIILLDSVMANSKFDFWPDPDAKGFDANQLPDDVSVEILREQRAKLKAIFSPATKNREGLDRRNLASLLPHSDKPSLVSPHNRGPFITVVGHDFETFAQESLRVSQVVAERERRLSRC